MKHRAFSPRAAVAATGIAAVLLVGGTTTGAVADVASASALSAQQATPTAPGAPTGLTAAPGNGTVTLSWSPPASDGGAAVEGYFIDGDGPAATVEVTPHVPGSVPSRGSVPGAPTGLKTGEGDGWIALAWSAPNWLRKAPPAACPPVWSSCW